MTYHARSKILAVLLCFLLEIDQVKRSIGKGFDGDDFEPCHNRRLCGNLEAYIPVEYATDRRIGTMSTNRDQANIPVFVSTRLVICANHGKTSVFTGSTRVWLQRAGMETRNDV